MDTIKIKSIALASERYLIHLYMTNIAFSERILEPNLNDSLFESRKNIYILRVRSMVNMI